MISMVREISPFLFDLGSSRWREMLNIGSRGRSNTCKLFGFDLSLLGFYPVSWAWIKDYEVSIGLKTPIETLEKESTSFVKKDAIFSFQISWLTRFRTLSISFLQSKWMVSRTKPQRSQGWVRGWRKGLRFTLGWILSPKIWPPRSHGMGGLFIELVVLWTRGSVDAALAQTRGWSWRRRSGAGAGLTSWVRPASHSLGETRVSLFEWDPRLTLWVRPASHSFEWDPRLTLWVRLASQFLSETWVLFLEWDLHFALTSCLFVLAAFKDTVGFDLGFCL